METGRILQISLVSLNILGFWGFRGDLRSVASVDFNLEQTETILGVSHLSRDSAMSIRRGCSCGSHQP